MEETFNVGNPTKENIDYAFKNLIFYITRKILKFNKKLVIIIKQDKGIDSTTLIYSNKQRNSSAINSYFALAKLVIKYGRSLPYSCLKPYK